MPPLRHTKFKESFYTCVKWSTISLDLLFRLASRTGFDSVFVESLSGTLMVGLFMSFFFFASCSFHNNAMEPFFKKARKLQSPSASSTTSNLKQNGALCRLLPRIVVYDVSKYTESCPRQIRRPGRKDTAIHSIKPTMYITSLVSSFECAD